MLRLRFGRLKSTLNTGCPELVYLFLAKQSCISYGLDNLVFHKEFL
jgi:hypothetical protein